MAQRWLARGRVRAGLPVGISIVLSAYFLAHGATRWIALGWLGSANAELAVGATGLRSPTRERVDGDRASPQSVAQAILARNIFDSETGPLWPPQPAEPAPPSDANPAPEPDAALAPCESGIRLVGTVYHRALPKRSVASLTYQNRTRVMYPGMTFENHRLDAVFPRSVILRQTSDDKACSLRLFQRKSPQKTAKNPEPKSKPKPKKAVSAASKRRNAGLDGAEIEQHIQRLSEHRYRVDRVLVDKLLSNRAGLIGVARLRPVTNDRGAAGVRLVGFKSQDLLGKLGLRSGDLLRTINGFSMGSPDAALEAYVRLKQADRLTLSVERRGKPISIQYEIR
jgi:general secretion pathway protein C